MSHLVTSQPKAIVLGGTIAHTFLIKQLKDRGYFVILVDFNSSPPAADVADIHIKESTLDRRAVLIIAKEWEVEIVISGCVDQANVTACYVAEKLNLTAPYSYLTSLRVTDKILMKQGMTASGIPTASYEIVTNNQSLSLERNEFPKIVKPSDSNGSKGVRKVNTNQELSEAISNACGISRAQKAIVEDFNSGSEVNAYFYLKNSKPVLLYVKGKLANDGNEIEGLNSFMSIGPEKIAPEIEFQLIEIAKKISIEFDLKNTPLLVQLNIDDVDIKVIEFAPRVGGGLAFREILKLTGFDMISAVIDSYLNLSVDLNFLTPNEDEKLSIIHCYGDNGTFDKVTGLQELKDSGFVEEFYIYKKPGDVLHENNLASNNRVFGMMIVAENTASLHEKIRTAMRRVSIISKDGREVLTCPWNID